MDGRTKRQDKIPLFYRIPSGPLPKKEYKLLRRAKTEILCNRLWAHKAWPAAPEAWLNAPEARLVA